MSGRPRIKSNAEHYRYHSHTRLHLKRLQRLQPNGCSDSHHTTRTLPLSLVDLERYAQLVIAVVLQYAMKIKMVRTVHCACDDAIGPYPSFHAN